ncbi:unnamed protein product [Brassicogethes aeneus]|uniref:V-type proton ATPase subunit E n=1 Tax=Brassicogethes aeneus TaxID=1431903 RepID=A0A9P0B1B5_BRAAE|nr:unnamed protein product [Brassicogethes aeneus]
MDDVQRQINHMIAFIEQEVIEKVEEIQSKAEEEYNIEKGSIIQKQRLKIIEFYNKKEKQLQVLKKVQNSHMKNTARLQVLNSREEFLNKVFDELKEKLSKKIENEMQYETILEKFTLQALLSILEKHVTIKVKQKDREQMKALIPKIQKLYKEKIDCNVTINLDDNNLGEKCLGGVEVYGLKGRLKITNTFDAKIQMLKEKALPYMRLILFGDNPNRRFFD